MAHYMETDENGEQHSKYLDTAIGLIQAIGRNSPNEFQAYIMLWHIREVADLSLKELEKWCEENNPDGLKLFKEGFAKYKLYQLK